jgi:hypothetical protein
VPGFVSLEFAYISTHVKEIQQSGL